MTRGEAVLCFKHQDREDHALVARQAAADNWRVTYDSLHLWQQKLCLPFATPEHPTRGRAIYHFYEVVGGIGKSMCAAMLIDVYGALEVQGASNDALFAIAQYVKHHNGRGPPIIIFDLARSHGDIDYEVIEKAKDGSKFSYLLYCFFPFSHYHGPVHVLFCLYRTMIYVSFQFYVMSSTSAEFFNGKYQGECVRYARPHVICFANVPPVLGMLSADRYRVVHLGHDVPLHKKHTDYCACATNGGVCVDAAEPNQWAALLHAEQNFEVDT